MNQTFLPDRREVVLGLTALPILSAACAQPRPAAARTGLIAGAACPVTPSQTEGPFYFDPRLVRSAIAEGRPGVKLRLRLQIVDAADCAAFREARVDIWHCDAGGSYSGYAGERSEGERFLRGTQFADADGVVSFDTIYPGWYSGRAPHIHAKAWTKSGSEEVTTQIYFPDQLSDGIYGQAPYAGRGEGRRLRNGDDGIFRDAGAGEATLAQVERLGAGWDGAIVIALG